MQKKLLLIGIVAAELGIIVYLGFTIARKKTSLTASVTPLSSLDIRRLPSERLKYFYDLSKESKTDIPDWLPYKPEYIRNNDQMNDRFDYGPEKPAGTFRIITLGDSWGFGMHVSTKDNYSEVLEDLLAQGLQSGSLQCDGVQRFEVLNLGVGGYDIEYMVERLRLHGMKYDPDLIIPIIKMDDFFLVSELYQPKMVTLMSEYGDLRPRTIDGVPVNPRQELAKRLEEEFKKSYSMEQLENYEREALRFLDTFYKEKILFFAYGLLAREKDYLKEYAEERGEGVYILDTVRGLRDEEKVPYDNHPGVLGHKMYADELYRYLIDARVIPCRA